MIFCFPASFQEGIGCLGFTGKFKVPGTQSTRRKYTILAAITTASKHLCGTLYSFAYLVIAACENSEEKVA
jgi:hypothetical protein